MLQTPGTVLLDTTRPDAENEEHLLFTDPRRVLRAEALDDVPAVLAALDAEVSAGRWVAGFLAYEAGYALLPVGEPPQAAGPLAWFGVYDAPRRLTGNEADALLREATPGRVREERFALDRATYRDRIAAIRHHIHEGDVYQVNFTAPLTFGYEGDPAALYATLRRRQRVAYGAFLNTGDRYVLSASPELFFRRDGDRVITRPMKGTIHRGRTGEEDAHLARTLQADEKSRAENLMIVDLLRNDLSVVCRPGTVTVPRLFETERYDTLIQMTSTVEGRLQRGTTYEALFRALFPCGSVTGAPKISAMRRIRALEDGPRGVYCGAIGYAAPGGHAVFNVAIRTLVLDEGRGVMGIGSGIVWDSDADAEYEECLLKAHFLTAPTGPAARDFSLIETMRWDGGITLLDLHLDRLASSSDYFGYPFDAAAFRHAVADATAGLPDAPHRVRATLDAAGRLGVTATPLPLEPLAPARLTVADAPVDPADPFFYHKTTRRTLYETAYRKAQEGGYDEVLFLNPDGEVAEGSRSNVFIRNGDQWATPPVAAGLLAGVYRRHLLATLPYAEERPLRLTDLAAADAVYVCNAVWGLREAVRPD